MRMCRFIFVEKEVEHEPTTCSCAVEGEWDPGLHYGEFCQQVKEGDPSPLLGTIEATPGVLCPVLGSQCQRDMDILERAQQKE